MLFNSVEFAVFLPIVFLFYWFVFKRRRWQNLFVVIASYVFYGWWDWRFLVLIVLTSICSFLSGLLLEKWEDRRGIQKAVSAGNIIVNLGILGIFKYYNFFVDSLKSLVNGLFGVELGWVTLQIILPVGISFYTFQALSYTIDVYRHDIRATHDPVEFFAYISFFPQLVAGPIERATSLLPQFQKERVFDYEKAVDGLRQMLWGFFKKIVIADGCASIVNEYWNQYQQLSGVMILILGVLFTLQIYCDFSGYSDIAIGCARLFGIHLMRNFDYPYFSRSIPEFWRRWHISLTSWFRDYIYFPLGGSRSSKWKTIRNVFIVWAVSGLWHGANWTFVCWGLYHGLILNIYNVFGIKRKYTNSVADGKLIPNVGELFQMLFTFVLASVGWTIFRAESLPQFAHMCGSLFNNSFMIMENIPEKRLFRLLVFVLCMFAVEWLQRNKQHGLQYLEQCRVFRKRGTRWAVYFLLVLTIMLHVGKAQEFIYFQF